MKKFRFNVFNNEENIVEKKKVAERLLCFFAY